MMVAAVNVHLPPSLPASRRRTVVNEAAAFLRTMGAGVHMLAGDLNKSLGLQGGSWLSQALSAR